MRIKTLCFGLRGCIWLASSGITLAGLSTYSEVGYEQEISLLGGGIQTLTGGVGPVSTDVTAAYSTGNASYSFLQTRQQVVF